MSDAIPPPPPETPPDQGIPAAPPSEPPPPSGKRSPLLIVGIVVGALVVLGAVGFFALRSKGGDGTYTANGVTFQYPTSWISGSPRLVAQQGTSVWSTFVGPSDGPDSVIVGEYTLQADIADIPPADAQAELTQVIGDLASGAGGELTSDVAPTTVGMLDGYEVSFTATVNDTPVAVDLTVLFHGTAQYNISCQHTDAAASEIEQGCTQIKDTFALTGESPAP